MTIGEHTKKYINDVKEADNKLARLKQTQKEQQRKLKELQDKQTDDFDFDRAEQVASKEKALKDLATAINQQENKLANKRKASGKKIKSEVSRDINHIRQSDKDIQKAKDKALEARKNFIEANSEFVKVSDNKIKDYEQELDKAGNNVANLDLYVTDPDTLPIPVYDKLPNTRIRIQQVLPK